MYPYKYMRNSYFASQIGGDGFHRLVLGLRLAGQSCWSQLET